jgi:hypothetical protein
MTAQSGFHETVSGANIEETIAKADLHQTSDALNLLSQAAELGTHINVHRMNQPMSDNSIGGLGPEGDAHQFSGPLQYELVSRGQLTSAQVGDLVAR